MKQSINYERLLDHIQSTVYEGILKLGYHEKERISIYYDLDLINYLLEQTFDTTKEALTVLEKCPFSFPDVSLQNNRFQFRIYGTLLETIYHTGEKNSFLKDMIHLVRTHQFTLEDVKSIFEKQTTNYTCEEIHESEFQYVLYFNDKTINQYKFCFSFDAFGGYYHRLLDYDYNKIMNEGKTINE